MARSPEFVTSMVRLRPKMVLVAIVCLACGIWEYKEWYQRFAVRSLPLVEGTVIQREPFVVYGFQERVDFSIQVDGSDQVVHARPGRYLINKVPEKVRFRFSGDPAREVFLFEHEEDPFWIMVLCFGGVALVIVLFLQTGKWKRELEAQSDGEA